MDAVTLLVGWIAAISTVALVVVIAEGTRRLWHRAEVARETHRRARLGEMDCECMGPDEWAQAMAALERTTR